METIRQHEARVREQQWAIQELRETLKNAGWLPPHSSKLRNPEKKGRYRHVKTFHFRVGQPGLTAHLERSLPAEERLRIYRECGYQMNDDDPIPGDNGSSSWAELHTQLARAVLLGYTQLESVGKTFFDIGFLLGRAVRSYDPLSNQERLDLLLLDYCTLHPYPGVVPLKPEPMPRGFVPEDGGWVTECQGAFRSPKLIHFLKRSLETEVACELQWEDDPYLVNIAHEYLLLLLFRAQFPEDQQLRLTTHRPDLFEQMMDWGAEHPSPVRTRYVCPA